MSTKHTQHGREVPRRPDDKAVPEVEMKFLIAPDRLATIKSTPIFMHKSTRVRLKSVYYDTVDFDLHKGGITLRVRQVGGAFIQTVKRVSGIGLFDRDEWESKITNGRPAASAWSETPVPGILGQPDVNTLTAAFTTIVQRTIRLWKEGTSLVEISLDHGKLVAGDLSEPIEEVELELKTGKVLDLFRVARRLGAGLKLSFDSKAQRGYRLIGQEETTSQRANPIAITSEMTTVAAFTLAARSCLAQVANNAELLYKTKSPTALHQLRVGLRRLQAVFATFKPVHFNAGSDRLKAEAKWLLHELNAARDLDVFISNEFDSAEADPKGDRILSAFGERLLQAQSQAYIRALGAVDSPRFAAFLLGCAEWVEVAPGRHSEVQGIRRRRNISASVLATHTLDRLRRQVRKSGKNLITMESAARHKFRVKAKHLRYTADFFAETFGKGSQKRRRKFISSLQTLQDSLGQLSDMVSARRNAAAVAGTSAEIAFRAGRVIGVRDRDQSKLLAKAGRAYERWHHARPFWH